MRGGGWIVASFTFLIWIACVAYPGVAAAFALFGESSTANENHPRTELMFATFGWAMAVAFGAILVGWAPGRWLGEVRSSTGYVLLAALCIVPISVPSYIVFYAWWQSWPADSALYEWLVQHDQITFARHATLYFSLVCWSWPLVAWSVAGATASRPAERDELLLLDGAGFITRFIDHARTDVTGLLLGGALVALATMNNTTCFDLAQVFTYANELRAIEALGATPHELISLSIPIMTVSALAGIAIWVVFGRMRSSPAVRKSSCHSITKLLTLMLWLFTVLVPIGLFVIGISQRNLIGGMIRDFADLYGQSFGFTNLMAMISACIGMIACVGFVVLWMNDHRVFRWCAHALAASWLITALFPGTILAVSLEAAYNRGLLSDSIYTQPVILTIGHLMCYGFIAALFAWFVVKSESPNLRDVRRLDGPSTLSAIVLANRPRIVAGTVATGGVIFILSLAEITLAAHINPPLRAGQGTLAMRLLNDMHYQRPEPVMIAALFFVLGSIGVSAMLAFSWAVIRRKPALLGAIFLMCLVGVVGCGKNDFHESSALPTSQIIGSPGRALGQFAYPRAIATDVERGVFYVVDKTARVQRFAMNGDAQLEWRMPKFDQGKPTGMSVSPDGRVFVADTHCYRVMVFDSDGNELFQFGEYGTAPGQFIYPTDVAFGPEGHLYVAEYGGNDRVQVFTPEGEFLFLFGSFGEARDQFNRPQSLAFNQDHTELYIADSCNHRIFVTDPSGEVIRFFGSLGRQPGQFAYPYSVTVLEDETLLICEFGNNRIQRVDSLGNSLGVFGTVGQREGELQYPWAVAWADDSIFVLDSGNNRIHVVNSRKIGVR